MPSTETLQGLIEKHVVKGSTVTTDCHASYGTLSQRGYRHYTVNHSRPGMPYVDPVTGANTNTVEVSYFKQVILF